MTLEIKEDSSFFGRVKNMFASLRSDGAGGVKVPITADTGDLDRAKGAVSDLRTEAGRAATVKVGVDTSGIAAGRSEIRGLRSETDNAAIFKIIADTSGVEGAAEKIEYVHSKALDKTFVIRADASGVAETGAELDHLDEKADNMDGRTINLDVDKSKIEAAGSAVDGFAGKVRDLGAVITVANIPTLVAGIATIPALATSAAAGVGALGGALGAGLAANAATAGSALGLAYGSMAATGLAAGSAVGNVLGMGKSFGSLAEEATFAEKQVKTFTELVGQMPAGTDAAAAAQQRLALAQQYQTDVTQLQIDWWGKYGDVADSLAASFYELRLSLVDVVSEAGGQLIPTIEGFVNVANAQMPAVNQAFETLTQGVREGAGELLNFLKSAQGMQDVRNVIVGIGDAAGPTFAILSDGAIVALRAIQPIIPAGNELLVTLSGLSSAAAEWATSAEGQREIADVWATLQDYGGRLLGVVENLGVGFYNLGAAVAASGLPDLAMGGLESIAQSFADATTNSAGLAANLERAGPILQSLGGLASTLTSEFLRMADAVSAAINPDTGNSTLVDIIDSLSASIGPIVDSMISTFEQLGPAIARNIGPLSEFVATFLGSSDVLVNVVDTLGLAAGVFNSLPEPIQKAAVEAVAFSAAWSLLGGPSATSVVGTVFALYTNLRLFSTLGNISATLDTIAVSQGAVGASAETAAGKVGILRGALNSLALLGGIFIAVEVVTNFDYASAKETYAASREQGRTAGQAFGDAYVAGIRAVPLVGPFIGWLDEQILKPTNDWLHEHQFSLSDLFGGAADPTAMSGTSGGTWIPEWLDANISQPVRDWFASVQEQGLFPSIGDLLAPGRMGETEGEGFDVVGWLDTNITIPVTDWFANVREQGLIPSLFDLLAPGRMGETEGEGFDIVGWLDANITTPVTDWFANVQEQGLIPSLWDLVAPERMGETGGEGFDIVGWLDTNITQPIVDWAATVQEQGLIPGIAELLGFDAESVADFDILGWLDTNITTPVNDWGNSDPLGAAFSAAWGYVTTVTSDFFTSLYNDYFLYYLGSDGVVVTAVSDFFSTLYNDYFLYYLGSGGVAVTAVSDFFSVLYNDWWLYYLGSDGLVITAVSEFFSVLYNDWWLYYLGADGLIITAVSEFFSVLYNDYWLYYFGPDGLVITAVSEFFSVLYNDYWLYYFGPDGLIITAISDFFTTLYETYWLPYFGPDGTLITGISEFFTSLYNDYFLYYLGPDGVVVTAAQEAWDAVVAGVESFGTAFADTMYNAFAGAINPALDFLATLMDGVDAVLTAIGASTLGVGETIRGMKLSGGGSTEGMAEGGVRGGKGTPGAQSRYIEWNEQSNGTEYWIATGDRNKGKQRNLTAAAANDLGMGVVPMAGGGLAGRAAARCDGCASGMAKGGMRRPSHADRGRDAADRPHRRGADRPNKPEPMRRVPIKAPYNPAGRYTAPGYEAVTLPMQGGGVIDWSQPPVLGWSEAAQGMVDQITGQFSTAANSYLGHGEQGGSTEDMTADFWSPGGQGSPIDPAVGEAIKDFVLANVPFGYMIWNGTYYDAASGSSFPFPEDPHYDHVHVSLTGGWGGGVGGGIAGGAAALFNVAKELWDSLLADLGTPDFGVGPLWDSVETYVGGLPSKAFDWLQTKIPHGANLLSAFTGSGGGGGGSCTGALDEALKRTGLGDQYRQSTIDIINRESGDNPGIDNLEGSGAAGCGQFMPDTFSTFMDPSCTDVYDPLCNVIAMLKYQEYLGGPGNYYHSGGVIPGSGDKVVMAEGGERVLTAGQNRAFEAMQRMASGGINLSSRTTSPGVHVIHQYQDTGTRTGPNIHTRYNPSINVRSSGYGGGSAGGGSGSGSRGTTGGKASSCQACAKSRGINTSGAHGSGGGSGGGARAGTSYSHSLNVPGQRGYGGSGPQTYRSGNLYQSGNTTNYRGGSRVRMAGGGVISSVKQQSPRIQTNRPGPNVIQMAGTGPGGKAHFSYSASNTGRNSTQNGVSSGGGGAGRGGGGAAGAAAGCAGCVGSKGGSAKTEKLRGMVMAEDGSMVPKNFYSGSGAGGNFRPGTTYRSSGHGVTRTIDLSHVSPGTNVQISDRGRTNGRLPRYHRGGLIPGSGDKLLMAQGGERVLPRDLSVAGPGRGAGMADATDGKLDELIAAVERGNSNPTPVTVDNVDEMAAMYVRGFYAGLESDEGKKRLDEGLAQGIRGFREMQTTGRPT